MSLELIKSETFILFVYPCEIRNLSSSHLKREGGDYAVKCTLFFFSRSQMMSQDDFTFISRFDGGNQQERDKMIQENPMQCAKTFYNLLGHISKDQTIAYLLTLVDDFLQEDKNRVSIFRDYAKKRK